MTESTKLKVLLLDIETAPNIGYVWGKYEQDVIKYTQEWYVLCFTGKWVDTGKTVTLGLPDFPDYDKNRTDDKALIEELWKMLDEADVIVAHNGDKFDIKKINTRFIVHGLTPPAPYKTVDTLKIVKKYFGFNSNKLGDIGTALGLGEKLDTGGFSLWEGCLAGKKDSWKKMKAYNKQDVLLLEKVYIRVRPWLANHPLVNHAPVDVCSVCSGSNLQKRGFSYTKISKYQRYQCTDCGHWCLGSIEKK